MEFPKEFAARMRDMLGAEYEQFERAFSSDAEYGAVRINTLKRGARAAVEAKLGGAERVPWCADAYYCDKSVLSGRHPYHAAGLIYFQEPSASAAVPMLGIKKGARVLDLCAAPGGKATQAAAALAGEGLLIANEIVPKRAKILSENIARLGIKNAVVTNETPERLAERFADFFDYIILDAPCSGEGMFRKEPRALQEWSAAHTEACALRQRHIADCAVKMLAAGGRLIYSTCTFAPCENEGTAAYILDRNPEMRLLPIDAPGLSDGCGEWVGSARDLSYTKRIFPHRAHGEGHFFALFEKTDGARAEMASEKGIRSPEYDEFCRQSLNNPPRGEIRAFGDRLYLSEDNICLDKLKVLRAGLELGEVRKGRFVPAYALCLAADGGDFAQIVDFSAEDDRVRAYLRGETVAGEVNGWCAVCADGFPLGWGKASGGVIKNHYPKYLRQF